MKNNLIFISLSCLFLWNCKKEEDPVPAPAPAPVVNTPKTYENITFNAANAYFSTDGSMTAPIDSTQAKNNTSKIDITFFFNYDYTEPGFLDPMTRSQEWYWNEFKKSWLSTAVETKYYKTALTKAKFDEAKADQTKIATLFNDTSVVLAPHAIFPSGSCIGGRETYSPSSVTLQKGLVFGFKNVASGKRGFLYIRTDQYSGWPIPIQNTNTKVDIIREK